MGRPGVSPAQRLADIVQETGQVKQEMRELDGSALTLYSIVQHSIASTIESLGLSGLPMLANAVVSNPAGFEKRLVVRETLVRHAGEDVVAGPVQYAI